ncbi:MAG TPA: EfeM/EfeO family lipoprotein [Polyangia bacterium]
MSFRKIAIARAIAVAGMTLSVVGCGSSSTDEKTQVASAMQLSMKGDLTTLWQASVDFAAAAPTPTGRGWDPTLDGAAFTAMKAAWIRAREAYEHVEGATAPIFPDIDVSIDERYDGFLATLGAAGDADPFDGVGVTGMHAIERILYSDVIPADVVMFETSLPGNRPAAFPITEAQAAEFKTGICAKLVTDSKTLLDDWTPQQIDVSGAFQGLVGLMNEQQEKVNKAASGEEESRYSQRTMADLRANLDGTTKIYGLFSDWLKSKPAGAVPGIAASGATIDASINAGFTSLGGVYGTITGDAIPAPPATWSAEAPSPADLQSPFGMLYEAVHNAVDPNMPGSVVDQMKQGATVLGIPVFTDE